MLLFISSKCFLRENLSEFNDVKVFQYAVFGLSLHHNYTVRKALTAFRKTKTKTSSSVYYLFS